MKQYLYHVYYQFQYTNGGSIYPGRTAARCNGLINNNELLSNLENMIKEDLSRGPNGTPIFLVVSNFQLMDTIEVFDDTPINVATIV